MKPKLPTISWEIAKRSRYQIVSKDKQFNICKVWNDRGGRLEPYAFGNAVLIASAPKLWEILNGIIDALDSAKIIDRYCKSESVESEWLDHEYARAKVAIKWIKDGESLP